MQNLPKDHALSRLRFGFGWRTSTVDIGLSAAFALHGAISIRAGVFVIVVVLS